MLYLHLIFTPTARRDSSGVWRWGCENKLRLNFFVTFRVYNRLQHDECLPEETVSKCYFCILHIQTTLYNSSPLSMTTDL